MNTTIFEKTDAKDIHIAENLFEALEIAKKYRNHLKIIAGSLYLAGNYYKFDKESDKN